MRCRSLQVGTENIDVLKTIELHLPGVLVTVGKTARDYYNCVLAPSREDCCCPRCKGTYIRNQGNMNRCYLDAFLRDDDVAVVTISLKYRKSKCMSPNCGCVFYPEIPFASPYSKCTHRLEDAIVRLLLEEGSSYSTVSKELKGKLSRQAIGQIFHRRVRELEVDTSAETRWFRELMQKSPRPYVLYSKHGRILLGILEE